jgi:hypothetical protein
MADETEQKLEAPKVQPAADSLTQPNSIRTKEDEAIWAKMQEPHKIGEHESATHIGKRKDKLPSWNSSTAKQKKL